MRFTKGKKIMLAGIIAGALFVGLCGNAAYDIVAVNAGEQVSPLPSEETAEPLPTPAGYQDVAGIPVTPGYPVLGLRSVAGWDLLYLPI